MSLLFGIVEGDAQVLRNNPRGERAARIDKSTRAMNTIEYEHHEIHAGSLYTVQTYSDSLASGAAINIVMTTPNTTKEVHLIFMGVSSGISTKEMFVGPTVTAGTGTLVTPLNHHFGTLGAGKPSTTVVRTGMTVTANGTLLQRRRIDSGGPSGSAGDLVRGVNEFILAQNTTYLFKLASGAAGNVVHMELTWYEHTPRD